MAEPFPLRLFHVCPADFAFLEPLPGRAEIPLPLLRTPLEAATPVEEAFPLRVPLALLGVPGVHRPFVAGRLPLAERDPAERGSADRLAGRVLPEGWAGLRSRE